MPKNKLNEEQKNTLNVLLNLIIPPSEDGKMPGATDVGFFSYVHNENIESFIQEILILTIDESHINFGKEFSALSSDEQSQLIKKMRRNHFRFYNGLAAHVIQCYYQHDDVCRAIGLEARPPFPDGYVVEEWDILLLEPVFFRGKIYRETEVE